MEKIDLLRAHGLFDAKVPRYTSYPPATQFVNGLGIRHQKKWLAMVQRDDEISVYIHIPFCKRLCWFCACSTQGTKTLRPVDAYVEVLCKEIETVSEALPKGIRMGRLHLGGGTPTILSPKTMKRLLNCVFGHFSKSSEFEFSVEIDPTEASEELLKTLVDHGLNRASLGVQDFAEDVQQAIGRTQSLEQTVNVISFLRSHGIPSLNLDLLYGLPKQTEQSFAKTIQEVLSMRPDRLAIYGYAHVPWVSKRQVLIKETDLPNIEQRLQLAQKAQTSFVNAGYDAIGIDHFALPSDGLAKAAKEGTLRRNFQGYTDDPSDTLIGFGASSISRFKMGFIQNAPATSAYQECVKQTGYAGYKGVQINDLDAVRSRMIMDLMCYFEFRFADLHQDFPQYSDFIEEMSESLHLKFPNLFNNKSDKMVVEDFAKPLVRIIAAHLDHHTSFVLKT